MVILMGFDVSSMLVDMVAYLRKHWLFTLALVICAICGYTLEEEHHFQQFILPLLPMAFGLYLIYTDESEGPALKME